MKMGENMEIWLPDGENVSWERFIYKAAKGSYKASEWLSWGEAEFAARKIGILYEDLSLADLKHTLNKSLLPKLPFNTLDEFLIYLSTIGLGNVTSKDRPFHEHDFYTGLWGRKEVDTAQLLHDSARFCFQNWSIATYWQLMDSETTTALQYNSQDVVSAMLFLVLSY